MGLHDLQAFKMSDEEILTIFSLLNPVQVERAEHPPMVLDQSLKDFKANRESIKVFLKFMLGEEDLDDTFETQMRLQKQAQSQKPPQRRKSLGNI